MKLLLLSGSFVLLFALHASGVDTKDISAPTNVEMKPSEGVMHEFEVILHEKLEFENKKNEESWKEILMDYHRKNGECQRDSDFMEYYHPEAQSCIPCDSEYLYKQCAVYRKRQELKTISNSPWLTSIPFLISIMFVFSIVLAVFTYKLKMKVETAKNQKINKQQQQQQATD